MQMMQTNSNFFHRNGKLEGKKLLAGFMDFLRNPQDTIFNIKGVVSCFDILAVLPDHA